MMLLCVTAMFAQTDTTGTFQYDSHGNPIKRDTTNQTLQHRDKYADSITISYRYLDSTHLNKIDSSINDFYSRYPVPWWYNDLGNFGAAAHSLIFQPNLKPGFDAGFHAYDIYRYTPENTKFFQTTRPYSETIYLIGSRAEQMIELFHTQNRKPNFNVAFDFRIINSPGAFKNQSTNNSNLRFNTFYQSKNKRYTNYFAFINNKILSSENGGLKPGQDLDSLSFNDPFGADTKLGSKLNTYRTIFNSSISIGTEYKESVFIMRHSYDFGQKDSLVVDSVTYKLFYPRFRIQHTIEFSKNTYEYHDLFAADSDYYNYFNYSLAAGTDSVRFRDTWKNLTNDFALISYPQKNNLNQFLKLNAGAEIINGSFDVYKQRYNNIYTGAEYRNRTRNQLYDVDASGKLYVTGNYTGDYAAYISLERSLRHNNGSLQIGFQNVNRTPSFIESGVTSSQLIDSNTGRQITVVKSLTNFPVVPQGSFKKENITRLFANITVPPLALQLSGEYYLFTNYTYFTGLYTATQASGIYNVLHVAAQKTIRVSRYFTWYLEGNLQQTAGNPPIALPLVLARSRFAFEGNFYKNLFLSTGIEIRYYTPYKAPGYNPLNGQFIYQDTTSITTKPDINFFFDFRIKSFKCFVRLENLDTADPSNGFSFTKYNFVAPGYPQRALWFRVGIWWNFVN